MPTGLKTNIFLDFYTHSWPLKTQSFFASYLSTSENNLLLQACQYSTLRSITAHSSIVRKMETHESSRVPEPLTGHWTRHTT